MYYHIIFKCNNDLLLQPSFPKFIPIPQPQGIIPWKHNSQAHQEKASTENFLSDNTQTSHSPKVQEGDRYQERKHSVSRHKTRYQHLDLKSPQSQMPRFQHKSKINNSLDNISTRAQQLYHRIFTIAETQTKDLKIGCVKMIEGLCWSQLHRVRELERRC